MDADIGHPYMVAGADDDRVFYTDEETGAVRFLDVYNGIVRVVAGPRYEDSSNDSASFGDGPAAVAGVADAAGIALDDRGRLVFADSGNRRVRSIAPLNLRTALLPTVDLIPTEVAPRGVVRIDVIGSSIVWTNTVWDGSIEGTLEDDLKAAGHNAWVQGIRMQAARLHDVLSYLGEVIAPTHTADVAVLVLNDAMLDDEGVDWESVLRTQLKKASASLTAEGIRLVVVYHPTAEDYLGPDFFKLDSGVNGGVGGEVALRYGITYDRVISDLRNSGVAFVDLWSDFQAWQKAPDHKPLFGTDDKHLSVAGRVLLGKLMAQHLMRYVTAGAARR
jgi:hypothetical protein